jgi:hypothetical protein
MNGAELSAHAVPLDRRRGHRLTRFEDVADQAALIQRLAELTPSASGGSQLLLDRGENERRGAVRTRCPAGAIRADFLAFGCITGPRRRQRMPPFSLRPPVRVARNLARNPAVLKKKGRFPITRPPRFQLVEGSL